MTTENLHLEGAPFLKEQNRGLYEPAGPKATYEAAVRSTENNREITDAIPYWQDWRNAAEQIKTFAVANLDKLLVQFEQNITARGAAVLWAETAEEANRLVLDIARRHNVKTVVKGKSMVSEEMELNHAFQSAGIRAMETDLGEYIVQLAGQRPTHIVTPALHLSAEDVGKLFEEKLGEPFSAEHEHLTNIARRHLREEYLKADMGMSGCNFAVADTGTLAVVENEGNVGLSTSTPPVHVALVGIEKMLPSIDYLPVFLNLLARVGTGQKLTSYTHLIHGATPGKELYVILLDNGRTKILQDPAARKALTCIRCGMCLNVCPVYRRVGGWAYGWVYPGPIGSIITPHLVGLKQAGTLPFASSLCGACSEVCPVKVDISHQLVHLRHRAVNEPSPANSLIDRITWNVWAWAMCGPVRYSLAAWAMRVGMRIIGLVPRSLHVDKLRAWTRGRELPPLSGPAFRTRWMRRRTDRKVAELRKDVCGSCCAACGLAKQKKNESNRP